MSTTPAHDRPDPEAPRDLVGVGIGPANLSLAALAHPLAELDAVFYEQRPAFDWHPACSSTAPRSKCRSWPTWSPSPTRSAPGRS